MNQPRNLAASVRQRLLNLAQAQREDFNLVLTRYGIERLLYRLEQSSAGERFILKGAMLFVLWSDTPHRTTKDADLLCQGDNSIAEIEAIFQAVCQADVVPDGLEFERTTVKGELIKAEREYPGVRIRLTAFIAGTPTRINLQIDVGFGDIVTPSAQLMSLPALLADLPAPQLYAYNRETVIAEKFEAMVLLGIGNTRMKDFYDLWYLSQHFTFERIAIVGGIKKSWRIAPIWLNTNPSSFSFPFRTKAIHCRCFISSLVNSPVKANGV